MPIRGKSKTAEDPNRALKVSAKKTQAKKSEPAPTETKTKVPKATTPQGIAPETKSPRSTTAKAVPSLAAPPVGSNRASTSSPGIADHRSDLRQVNHGLNLAEFDANRWMAGNLFTNSSPLPETSQADADTAVLSIARKRQTLRIVRENIGLNRDVVGAATDYQKLVGDVINYSTELVNNQTKYIKYLDAGVKQHIAGVKLAQSQEQHTQEAIVLEGLQRQTPLVQEEWNERIALRHAKINSLREQTLNATARLESKRQELEGLLNVNFQAV